MSDELYEVAFSGQIKSGADLAQVKIKVAAMFKADDTKLAHLFSGQRMVIKKNINQATAKKYQTALDNAGAVCDIKLLSSKPVPEPVVASAVVSSSVVRNVSPVSEQNSEVAHAPQTEPLGITAGDIAELSVGLAPIGSDMQDEIEQVAALELNLDGMDMAPAGSDLGQVKKDEDPEPPNTDGLSLVD